MGGGGSKNYQVKALQNMTPAEVAKVVVGLGGALKEYGKLFEHNCVSGEMLASMKEDDFMKLAEELGISSNVHRKAIFLEFQKHSGVGGAVPAGGKATGTGASRTGPGLNRVGVPETFDVGDCVTVPPRTIMTELFKIQGIDFNIKQPTEPLAKIAAFVGKSIIADGVTTYDCFISYRVAADRDAAETIYAQLKTLGVHAFLDSKCLVDGLPWKEGFIKGLKNSRSFLCLISAAAYEPVRDYRADHTYDNVLLECETALKIKGMINNPRYICPVLIGSHNNSQYSKFSLFNPSLYPESITRTVYKCPYNVFYFHPGKYYESTMVYSCCDCKERNSRGCTARKLTAADFEEIESGILRTHTQTYETCLGIFSNSHWNCCAKEDKLCRGCKTEKMSADYYRMFFTREGIDRDSFPYVYEKF